MQSNARRFCVAAVAAFVFSPLILHAQAPAQPARDSTPAKPAATTLPPIDFSGTLFANFQYRGDKGPAKGSNKFDVERVYLTFRMPAGDKTSIRGLQIRRCRSSPDTIA